jgi:tetratricopeptide (TPR) repeat protein
MRSILVILCLVQAIICNGSVFDTLKLLPAPQRMAKAQDIYNKQLKHRDSVFAIHELKELSVLAGTLQDKSLGCFAVSLLADHYARMRSFNEYATSLHKQAIRMAEEEQLQLMTAICTYRTGRYYYSFKQYPLAFEYLLRADNYFKAIGYNEVPDMDGVLYVLGGIYYETGNYEKATSFLLEIQSLPQVDYFIRKQSLNTLALINRQSGDTARALHYFQQTLDIALVAKDSIWMGVCYGNIGSLYFFTRQYKKAYPLLQQALALSLRYQQWGDAYADLLLLSRIDLMQNNIAAAAARINAAINMKEYKPTLNSRKILYETQVAYYRRLGQDRLALDIQDQLLALKDSIARSSNQQAYREIQLRIESEKHLSDIGKLAAEAHTRTLRRNAAIVALVLLILVLLLLYRNHRMQTRNAAAALQADKLRAEEKLKYARQLLQNFTENTRQKNALIDQFAAELEKLKAGIPGQPSYEERMKNFNRQFRSGILTTEAWNSFEELFEKVHKGFFARLSGKHPTLSITEMRLAALSKLELDKTEIGNMMGMDTNTVQVSLELLRQKLGGERELTALVREI